MEMKPCITIKNVGPIKDVKLPLNRINVLVAPQSSGKSTIAKLISTLSWMEKEACTTMSENILPAGKTFKQFVEDYHRIHGYIDEKASVVKYDSEYVTIEYDKGSYSLTLKDKCIEYKRVKVSYMPSDRNVITMRDIELRSLEETNFRSFLFDWLEARRSFYPTKMADILALDVKYYFDKERNMNQDRITHQNGKTYDISLYDASSGLQSAVPLVVLMTYLQKMYFDNYGKSISFDTKKREEELMTRLVKRILVPKVPHADDESVDAIYHRVNQAVRDGNREYRALLEHVQESYNKLNMPQSISYIIEEPEQNLFPQTQCDLLQFILSACTDAAHPCSVVLTTHSPYMLYSLNNCMVAYSVKDQLQDPELREAIDFQGEPIDPKLVSVWELRDGKLAGLTEDNLTIQDENGWIRGNYFNRVMKNVMADFNNMLSLLP